MLNLLKLAAEILLWLGLGAGLCLLAIFLFGFFVGWVLGTIEKKKEFPKRFNELNI